MAARKMKKMALAAMLSDRDRLMRALQSAGCVDIIDRGDASDGERRARAEDLVQWIERLDRAIARLAPAKRFRTARGRPTAGEDAIAAARARRGEAAALVGRLEEIDATLADIPSREARERALLRRLRPWAALEIPVERVGKTALTETFLASVPALRYARLRKKAAALGAPVAFERIASKGRTVRLCVCCHQSASGAVDALLRASGARRSTKRCARCPAA